MYFIFTLKNLNWESLIEETGETCLGWFDNEKEAVNFVESNRLDINETCYDYALISFIPQGIYRVPVQQIWFKFNYDIKKYEKIEIKQRLGMHFGYLA